MNVWDSIPLMDYEQHMDHPTVGQLQLLADLTGKFFTLYKPETAIILGVAGGNGLDRLNPEITKRVIGIDINAAYLTEVGKRYGARLPQLELVRLDLSQSTGALAKADLIWVALILEYVDMDGCLQFIKNNLGANGCAVVTIQSNNGVSTVSNTGIESMQAVGKNFTVIDPAFLIQAATQVGLDVSHAEENFLPSGKSFKTFTLVPISNNKMKIS